MNEKISFLSEAKDKVSNFKSSLKDLAENIAILPTRTKLLVLFLLGNGVNVSAKELNDNADKEFFGDKEIIENVLDENTFSDNDFTSNEADFNLEVLQDTIKSLGTEKEEPYWSNSSINSIGSNPAIPGYNDKTSNEKDLQLSNKIKSLIEKWHRQFPDQIGTVEEIEKAHQEYYSHILKPNTKNLKFNFGRGEVITKPLTSKNYIFLNVPLSHLYIRKSSSQNGEVAAYENSISNLSSDVFVILDKDLDRVIWAAPDGCGNASIIGFLEITEIKPEVIEKKVVVKDTVFTPKDTVFVPVDCPEKPEEVKEGGFRITPKVEAGIRLGQNPDMLLPSGVSIWYGYSGSESRSISVRGLNIDGNYKFHLSYDGRTSAGEFTPSVNGDLSYDLGTTKPTYVLVENNGQIHSYEIPWGELNTDDKKKKGETNEHSWLNKKESDLGPNFMVNVGAEVRHSEVPGWYGEAGVSSSIYANNLENTSFNAYLEVGKDFVLFERDGKVGLRFLSPSIGPSVRNAFEPGSWGIEYGIGFGVTLESLEGVNLGLELNYTKGQDGDINAGNNTFKIKGEDKWNVGFKFTF